MMFGWIIIIVILYFIFVKKDEKIAFKDDKKSPEEVLKNRYVNGEISEEEYMRMKSVLNK